MQFRRVRFWRVRRTFHRKLNQVAGDKSRRNSKVAQTLHKQPRRVTTRSCVLLQRLLAALNSRLQPRCIPNFIPYPSIQVQQQIDSPALPARKTLKKCLQPRRKWFPSSIRLQIVGKRRRIRKRILLKSRFQEKIERIDRRQIRNQVHIHHEFVRLTLKNNARLAIVVGVQLPIQNVVGRNDIKAIAQNGRATMQCGAQLDNLWAKGDCFFIPVAGPVIQRNVCSHPPSCGPHLE